VPDGSTDEAVASKRDVEALLATFARGGGNRRVAVSSNAGGLGYVGVDADVPSPAASVIKVPLMMALYDMAARGTVSLSDDVPISELGGTRYASILAAFDAGRSLSVGELAALALIVSDNPATVHLMKRVEPEAVAAVLRLCCCSEHARLGAGFSEDELGAANRVNQLTALDAVKIFEVAASEPRYRRLLVALENNLRNNRIPAMLPDEVVVAHKTGSLAGVVNDVGILSYGGKSFTLAVLTDEQDDPIATSRDIAALSLKLCQLLLGIELLT
jgi:beta-lactamase class A